MKTLSLPIQMGALGIILAMPAQPLLAQTNLVNNPGFETGTASQWTFTPADTDSFAGINFGGLTPHTGSDYFGFAAFGGQSDTLSQAIPVTAGATYDVNFWLDTAKQPGGDMTVAFDGQSLLTLTGQAITQGTDVNGWADFDFKFTVPTSQSSEPTLSFAGQSASGVVGLGDVSVTSTVPEPETLGLFSLALGCLGWRRLRLGK